MPRPLYPVTIIKTRYQGTYEGGTWAAFHEYPDLIPEDATGSDVECSIWWSDNGERVGLGSTPDEALANLEAKLSTQDGGAGG